MSKSIEEITLNTWPALQTVIAGGWLLRYANGYTKRANSVNPLYFEAEGNVYKQIQFAESYYSRLHLDTVFKMTPFAAPGDLDKILEILGYTIHDPCYVMTLDLGTISSPAIDTIKIEHHLEEEWLDHFAAFSHLSPEHKDIARRMFAQSTFTQGFATLYHGGVPIACGVGVIQHPFIGLYDIVTQEGYRKQGFGEQLVLHLLQWGRLQGATQSFLQVLQQNEPAMRLYQKLGYKIAYPYWYRIKKLE